MIRDVQPGSGFFLSIPDPDPGVKKAQKHRIRSTALNTGWYGRYIGTNLISTRMVYFAKS